jgi:hypothetical protein
MIHLRNDNLDDFKCDDWPEFWVLRFSLSDTFSHNDVGVSPRKKTDNHVTRPLNHTRGSDRPNVITIKLSHSGSLFVFALFISTSECVIFATVALIICIFYVVSIV